jgi:hypothetical protein
MSSLTKRFSHRYFTQHLTDVVLNTAYSHLAYRGPNEEIDARIRDFYKAFSAEVDCSSISTLSLWLPIHIFPNIFQLQAVSLTGIRRIAVHREHDFLLVLFARWQDGRYLRKPTYTVQKSLELRPTGFPATSSSASLPMYYDPSPRGCQFQLSHRRRRSYESPADEFIGEFGPGRIWEYDGLCQGSGETDAFYWFY